MRSSRIARRDNRATLHPESGGKYNTIFCLSKTISELRKKIIWCKNSQFYKKPFLYFELKLYPTTQTFHQKTKSTPNKNPYFCSNINTTTLFMLIIGIAGGTGSGKTTVVHQIMNELPHTEVGIIAQDSYYKESKNESYEERSKTNFDHPRAIDFDLLVTHLKELKEGKTINQPVYSFATHNRTDDTIVTHPRKVMIVEGILILSHPELRDLFDIKIFVHADSDERLIRRLKRDIAERGRDMQEVLTRYQTTLKPMHQQFIESTKAFADIIIPNDKYNTVAIDVVRAVINQRIL